MAVSNPSMVRLPRDWILVKSRCWFGGRILFIVLGDPQRGFWRQDLGKTIAEPEAKYNHSGSA